MHDPGLDTVTEGGPPAPSGARGAGTTAGTAAAAGDARDGPHRQVTPARAAALLAVTLALAAALFALLAGSYDRGALLALDEEAFAWQSGLPGAAVETAEAFDALGGHLWLPLITVAAFAYLLVRGRRADALFLVVAAALSDAFLHLLKVFVDRDRAEEGPTLPDDASFPSGHATTAIAIYGTLGLLAAWSPNVPRTAGRAAVTAALALGLVVGAARFVAGDRTLTEVLAGAALGIAWLAGMLLVRRRLVRRRAA